MGWQSEGIMWDLLSGSVDIGGELDPRSLFRKGR